MPYFIDPKDGKHCVVKGTKDAPGESVKCHESPEAALAHLRALYANVEDAVKDILNFKDGDTDRFLMIWTVDRKDLEDETFGAEAIDWGINWVKDNDAYPEQRVIHVRGLKSGTVDKLYRVGPYGVAEGAYLDTPFAKEVKKAVDRRSMGKVSVGFSVVEASGDCPCGSRLLVGPRGLKVGFQCPACSGTYSGKELRGVRFTKAIPFDLTVTDRPAVPWTAITNFTVQKEHDVMTKEQIRQRLLDAEFAPEVVDAYLGSLSEDDLKRMKEDDVLDRFKEALAKAEVVEEDETEIKEGGGMTCPSCGHKFNAPADEKRKDIEIDLAPIQEQLVAAIKDALPGEIEIDIPGLEDRLKEIVEKVDQLGEQVEVLSKSEEDRLKELVDDASPATRTRLTWRFKNDPDEVPEEKDNGDSLKDIPGGDGQFYESVSAIFGVED